jgi:hypothetical protein
MEAALALRVGADGMEAWQAGGVAQYQGQIQTLLRPRMQHFFAERIRAEGGEIANPGTQAAQVERRIERIPGGAKPPQVLLSRQLEHALAGGHHAGRSWKMMLHTCSPPLAVDSTAGRL